MRFLAVVLVLLTGIASAQAQGFPGYLGAGHAWGNPTAAEAEARDTSLSALFDQAFCNTNGQSISRVGGTWGCSSAGAGSVTSVQIIAGTGLSESGTCTITTLGACTLALGNQISAAGPIGSATAAPVITFNAQGQLTAVTSTTVTPAWGSITGTPTTLSGYGIASPLPVNQGGTASASASGTALDNITGFSGTGFIKRTGAGTYTFTADPSDVTSVSNSDGSLTISPTTGAVVASCAASTVSQLGCVKPDGTSITVSAGIISGNGISALTGDVSATGPGSVAATLATVNSNVGSFGSSTSIPSFTVNGKGLMTAAAGNAVIAPAGTLSGTALNSTVVSSSLTSVGTLTGGATGAGFTLAVGTSTVTGTFPAANLPLATTGAFGAVKPDGTSITVSAGVISAAGGGGGGASPATNIQTANYTIATTDCWKTVQAGTGSTGQFTVTLPAVAGFATNCWVIVENGDTARGKILSGFPSDLRTVLYPKQALAIQIINGAWATVQNPGRWRVPSAPTFFVNTGASASDTLNDGLGDGALGAGSFATIQHCINTIYNDIDAQQTLPVCSPKTGQTFTEGDNAFGQITGNNVFQINGNGGAFTWAATGQCIQIGDNAEIGFSNVTFSCNTGNSANTGHIFFHQLGVVDINTGVSFVGHGSLGSVVFCDGNCRFNVNNGVTLSGTFNDIFHAGGGAYFLINNTIVASASPTIGQMYTAFSGIAFFNISGNVTYTGTWGSMRQWAILNNSVLCNAGATVPGSAGITTSAGFANGATATSC